MEIEVYRNIIKKVIQEYAAFLPGYDGVEGQIIFDDERGHYMLVYNGWDGKRRVHGSAIHIDLSGDKVWVQHDGTKDGIVDELLAAGIPKEHIILGFHHPIQRKSTEFATT
ncbi:MAG TPA: XisI protein [Chthonomonadaceae bacterium]|nr:XisI protein [Chthonomonadaceae bacterium]